LRLPFTHTGILIESVSCVTRKTRISTIVKIHSSCKKMEMSNITRSEDGLNMKTLVQPLVSF
jgi:hypothetical protein